MFVIIILEVHVDVAAHFEQGILIRCDIKAKVVSCFGIEYLMSCRISSTISNINTFEVLIIIWNPYYKPDIFIIMTYVQWPYK
jgi:hypothetical protein